MLTIKAAMRWANGTKIWSLLFPSLYPLNATTIEKVWIITNPRAIIAVTQIEKKLKHTNVSRSWNKQSSINWRLIIEKCLNRCHIRFPGKPYITIKFIKDLPIWLRIHASILQPSLFPYINYYSYIIDIAKKTLVLWEY